MLKDQLLALIDKMLIQEVPLKMFTRYQSKLILSLIQAVIKVILEEIWLQEVSFLKGALPKADKYISHLIHTL